MNKNVSCDLLDLNRQSMCSDASFHGDCDPAHYDLSCGGRSERRSGFHAAAICGTTLKTMRGCFHCDLRLHWLTSCFS